jgi:hypothetical protein
VIGIVQGQEALWMLRSLEDESGIFDADDLVPRSVANQERLAQSGDGGSVIAAVKILDEFSFHRELAPGKNHLGLAVGRDGSESWLEEVGHVSRIGWSAHRAHRLNFVDARSSGQHGGTTERVPHQEDSFITLANHKGHSRTHVLDVVGKSLLGELAATLAETGEVETKHVETPGGEGLSNSGHSLEVFGAGETVGEDDGTSSWPHRPVAETGETLALGIVELDSNCSHLNHLEKKTLVEPVL